MSLVFLKNKKNVEYSGWLLLQKENLDLIRNYNFLAVTQKKLYYYLGLQSSLLIYFTYITIICHNN